MAKLKRLQRTVEGGYREGVRTIVEVVDARRARTAIQIRGLELALAAKEAELALRAAQGDFARGGADTDPAAPKGVR